MKRRAILAGLLAVALVALVLVLLATGGSGPAGDGVTQGKPFTGQSAVTRSVASIGPPGISGPASGDRPGPSAKADAAQEAAHEEAIGEEEGSRATAGARPAAPSRGPTSARSPSRARVGRPGEAGRGLPLGTTAARRQTPRSPRPNRRSLPRTADLLPRCAIERARASFHRTRWARSARRRPWLTSTAGSRCSTSRET